MSRMEKKTELNEGLLESLAAEPLLAAYVEINHLKQLYRQGWLRAGISREACESVAEHIFGMAMLAWLVIGAGLAEGVDREKTLRMVLAHELGEIYVGDIIPSDGVPAEEKQRLEREAVEKVTGRLPGGEELAALWEEFEAGQTPEARLTRQLDRLEMALQAMVYQKQGLGRGMDSFFRSAKKAVRSPELAVLLEQAQNLR